MRCALCGRIDPEPICARCDDQIERMPPEYVALSGPLSRRAGVASYEGRGAQAVQRLKYNRVTSHARRLGEEMAKVAQVTGLDQVHAVVPVPIHPTRRCMRGFNQSDLLAEAFANVRKDLLRRTRATRPQVGLTIADRLDNLRGAFAAQGVSGMTILLLDDVTTSGGTAIECAQTLRAAGATDVYLLTYAVGQQ